MAADTLKQLSKQLGRGIKSVEQTTRRFAENFPEVERLRDVIGILVPYTMEFKTYRTGNQVNLNVWIEPVFDEDAIKEAMVIPLTITQTGLGVGLNGQVGAADTWYPLVYMGDLNFEGGHSYAANFVISKYGTGTYHHKVVFSTGGVDLTDVTTVGTTTIIVPVTGPNVLVPPNQIIYDAYIYGMVTDFSVAGWLHYESVSLTMDGQPYAARKLPFLGPPVYIPPPPPPPVEAPVANYTLLSDTPLLYNFFDKSTNNPTTWEWDFGDGETSTTQNPLHTFLSAGTYDISLTVTNEAGSDTLLLNLPIV